MVQGDVTGECELTSEQARSAKHSGVRVRVRCGYHLGTGEAERRVELRWGFDGLAEGCGETVPEAFEAAWVRFIEAPPSPGVSARN
jgi:hypothetical protein